ncbi:Multifunctional tryptophan biosynthesis, partial [Hortaea werneckii]
MRAKETSKFIAELLGGGEAVTKSKQQRNVLVKVCGTRSAIAAETAISAGADLIGMILVKGRKRCVDTETALQISQAVHTTMKPAGLVEAGAATPAAGTPALQKDVPMFNPPGTGTKAHSFFEHTTTHFLRHPTSALLVGVFQDQPLKYILEQVDVLGLDIVQLHGNEPIEWANLIPRPVIRAFKPGQAALTSTGYHSVPLLDSGAGGTGEQLATPAVKELLEKDEGLRVILAGGLNADNVQSVVKGLGDVAGS